MTQHIKRQCLSFPKSIGHVAGIIDTPIWSSERHPSPARLHSALCEGRQEAFNLVKPTIKLAATQVSFDCILLWLSGRNTLSFVQREHFSFLAQLICVWRGAVAGPVGDREMSGRQCTKDAGVLWFRYHVLEEALLRAASVSCCIGGEDTCFCLCSSVWVYIVMVGHSQGSDLTQKAMDAIVTKTCAKYCSLN